MTRPRTSPGASVEPAPATPPTDPGEPTEVELLQQVSRQWRRASAAQAADRGLSPHQERALVAVDRMCRGHGHCEPAPAGVRVTTLAERLRIAPRSATEVADTLERAGLLRRDPDPSDRRAVLLSLTDAGQEVVRDVARSRREAAERAMAHLSAGDRAELRRILEALLRTE